MRVRPLTPFISFVSLWSLIKAVFDDIDDHESPLNFGYFGVQVGYEKSVALTYEVASCLGGNALEGSISCTVSSREHSDRGYKYIYSCSSFCFCFSPTLSLLVFQY